MRFWLLMTLILTIVPETVPATTRRVPAPFSTIQAAIDASGQGDTVRVGPGTYTGSGNTNLVIDVDLVLIGEEGAQFVIIDCGGSGRGITVSGASPGQAWIVGFTIRNAGEEGMRVENRSATIGGCVITGCGGGGMKIEGSASCTMADMTIVDNESDGNGGGLYVSGSSISLIGGRIQGNQSSGNGGGIALQSSGLANIGATVITGNTAASGAGVAAASSMVFLSSCTIAGNDSDGDGGGVLVDTGSSFFLYQTIVHGNCAGGDGPELWTGGGTASITCSVLDLSDTGPGVSDGGNNHEIDPLFCEPLACGLSTGGNYRLQNGSPALNDGTCGLIGALGDLNCAEVAVRRTTWSSIKTMH